MLLIQNELFFSDAKPNTSLFLGGGVDVAAYVWEHLKKTNLELDEWFLSSSHHVFLSNSSYNKKGHMHFSYKYLMLFL